MPFLLTRVPLVAAERIIASAGVPVTLRVNQPVVWVRLAAWDGSPVPTPVAFPAVLDTGNNYSFLIPATLFQAWTGLDLDRLTPLRTMEANGLPVGCYPFNLDLLRIRAGRATDRLARQLHTDRGIVIVSDAYALRFPRMPVIGVRCLTVNRITFTLNGDKRTFSLFQPGRVTPAPRGSA
jgi:hypothetical protein